MPATIVVIEDEQHLALGIQVNLTQEGYHVETFSDGPSGLEYLAVHHQNVDLIVLDLMLPEMSGYAVCERIRGLGYAMPVLILSARTLSEDRTRGFEVGADQYMMKPFELEEFLSRVRNMLARYRPKQRVPQVFDLAGAHVDLDALRVEKSGTVTQLTTLEAKLLKYFLANEGRVIPRSELLEQVWEMPGHLNTRAPDQFLRRLRKLFEPDPARPRHFVTIREAGYRFILRPE